MSSARAAIGVMVGGLILLASPRPGRCAEDPRAVEQAIQRGARWLLPETQALRVSLERHGQRGGAAGLGGLALRVLALLRSGVRPELLEPELRLLEALPHGMVYDVSLLVLALEGRGVERIPPGPGEVHPTFRPHPPDPATLDHMRRATVWLLARERQGKWGYGTPNESHWDTPTPSSRSTPCTRPPCKGSRSRRPRSRASWPTTWPRSALSPRSPSRRAARPAPGSSWPWRRRP